MVWMAGTSPAMTEEGGKSLPGETVMLLGIPGRDPGIARIAA